MSKIRLAIYVNFQGQAREALEFYHQVLGGNLELHTINEQGASKPAGPGDRIAHARLEADAALIIATDGRPDSPVKVGDNMAIALSGTDKDRVTTIFNDLAEGGRIKMPLTTQASGADVGWLADRFGISWMVTVDRA